MKRGLVVDLFAGGGGASIGIEAALGRPVDIAINHSRIALAVHKANHPKTKHLTADIWEVKPKEAVGNRAVDVLWASPDCTHFSVAKGNVPRKQNIRSLAWAVVRWASDVRPRLIFLENVAEFRGWGPLGADGKPNKAKMGLTFKRWVARLQNLGYVVDYRVLDASAYGAPTRRRRLFLIARRDGLPICWPEPTHGPGLLPYRTAAECIDWSRPCPSIFERRRPLAEKTMWRIAEGIRRFVLENADPFIVRMAHGEVAPDGTRRRGHGSHGIQLPLPTITGSGGGGGFALATPSLMKFRHDSTGAPLDQPMPTITAGGHERPGRPATGNPLGLLAPTIVKVNHGKNDPRGEAADAPLSTVTATQRGHALVAPSLIQVGYGERQGQDARVLNLHQPLGTVVAQGQKHALTQAFLVKHFGGVVGHGPERPIGTITARDHHALAAATMVRFNHDDNGVPADAPMPTVTATGGHIAEVRAFLMTYYSSGNQWQTPGKPLRTLTGKARFGLVTVEGVDYQIVDIGMRMLEPEELLAAQFGRFAAAYDMRQAKTKASKVRLIGNSVCPEIAEAIVRANYTDRALEVVA